LHWMMLNDCLQLLYLFVFASRFQIRGSMSESRLQRSKKMGLFWWKSMLKKGVSNWLAR